MDGGITDHAGHDSLRPEEADAAGGSQCAIRASDGAHGEKTFVVDVADDEADFVSMGLQHHSWSLGIRSIQNGPGVAVGVGFDAVGEGGDVFDPKLLALFFPTGRARDGEDFEEVFGFHISEWVDLDLV